MGTRDGERVRGAMQARRDRSLELIGDGLRDIWRDVVASPLPDRIRHLLEELRRRECQGRTGTARGRKTTRRGRGRAGTRGNLR